MRKLLFSRSKHIIFGSILGCLFLVGIGYIGANSEVSASALREPGSTTVNRETESTNPNEAAGTSSEVDAKFLEGMETVIKVVYLLMRPFLAIAGASLDNSLVYGQIFYLDTTLRKFRNIMRSFSMYTLGFLFVGSIAYAYIKQDAEVIKKLIKRLFVAGFLINISRWMVSAMIDLSTIAVVAVGALPLHAIGDAEQDEIFLNARYTKSHSMINMAASQAEFQDQVDYIAISSCAGTRDRYYLPCWVENEHLVPMGSHSDDPQTRMWYKKQFTNAWAAVPEMNVNEKTISDDYCTYGKDLIKYEEKTKMTKENEIRLKDEGIDELKTENGNCATLNSILADATGTSGPLYTLYGSVFQMSNLALIANVGNLKEASIEMVMKVVVGLALIIPLIALATALLIRVVFLRGVIAFSPILILAYVFEFKQLESLMEGKLKLGTIVSLIFLPVFATFAISISLLFMTLLSNIDWIERRVGPSPDAPVQEDGLENDMLTAMGGEDIKRNCSDTDVGSCCYNFLNITEICFEDSSRVTGANIVNTMSWLVVNVFGIALMRIIIFTVLKSNEITKGAVGAIEGMAKTGLSSIPIIPLPGGGTVGVGAASQAIKSMSRDLPNKLQQSQYENSGLRQRLEALRSDIGGDNRQRAQEIIRATSSPQSFELKNFKATPNQNFNDFNNIMPAVTGAIRQKPNYENVQQSNSWGEALRDREFVKYMQDTGTYNEQFYRNWEQTGVPEYQERSFDMMEDSMASIVNDPNNENTFSYKDPQTGVGYYWVNGHLTTFRKAADANGRFDRRESTITTTPFVLSQPGQGLRGRNEVAVLTQLINQYRSVDAVRTNFGGVFGSVLDENQQTENNLLITSRPEGGNGVGTATITAGGTQYTINLTYENGNIQGASMPGDNTNNSQNPDNSN